MTRPLQTYSTPDVAKAVGVPIETLRNWRKPARKIVTTRHEGRYTLDELTRVVAVAELSRYGIAPSESAPLVERIAPDLLAMAEGRAHFDRPSYSVIIQISPGFALTVQSFKTLEGVSAILKGQQGNAESTTTIVVDTAKLWRRVDALLKEQPR